MGFLLTSHLSVSKGPAGMWNKVGGGGFDADEMGDGPEDAAISGGAGAGAAP